MNILLTGGNGKLGKEIIKQIPNCFIPSRNELDIKDKNKVFDFIKLNKINSVIHAAALTNGSKIGILHGAAQYVVQDNEGQIGSTESISAGLDYPGISPLHCFLKDTKRAKYTSASDEDALKAYKLVSSLENISPSLEPSHAFAEAIRIAPKLKSSEVIIVNSCGDSLKDKDIIKKRLGTYIR